MLQSQYALQAPHPKALTFAAKEQFIPLQSEAENNEKEWWLVLSKNADVGYVPKNYVTYLPASQADLVQFISVARLSLPSHLAPDQRATRLARLDQLMTRYGAGDCGGVPLIDQPPPVPSRQKQRPDRQLPLTNGIDPPVAPPAPQTPSVSAPAAPSPMEPPAGLAHHLVELLRLHTSASHQASCDAVRAVLGAIAARVPSFQHLADGTLEQLSSPSVEVPDSADARRLRQLLDQLRAAAGAWQQRSWKLEDDEPELVSEIEELATLLADADPAVSRQTVEEDQLSGPLALAQLYLAEPNWQLRRPLCRALGLACGLSGRTLSALLACPLPSELAREMRSALDDDIRLSHATLLLTMLLSMGEKLPISHMAMLGADFSSFLLECVEQPPSAVSDDTVDLLLALLLALNLQDEAGLQLRHALSHSQTSRNFTEKLMLLFNREEDPVRLFDHEPAPPHAVLKAMVDLFHDRGAARLFYTNDVRVLLDIVVRNLADLSPGDTRRQEYLRLCARLLDSDEYSEHRHRSADIASALRRIADEEQRDADNVQDTQLAATLLALHNNMLTGV